MRSAAGPLTSAVYLRHGKIKQGQKIFGWVILRPEKGATAEVNATSMMDEIDILLDGVVFRF